MPLVASATIDLSNPSKITPWRAGGKMYATFLIYPRADDISESKKQSFGAPLMRLPPLSLFRRVFPARRIRRPGRTSRLTLEQLESRLVPSQTGLAPILANPGNPAIGTDPNSSLGTTYAPPNVAVAQDAAGSFVEVWFSTGNGNEVLAQRFDRLGNAVGHEITIAGNYSPATQNPIPAVGMDSAGDFVVAYDTAGGIFASRFDAAGTSLDGSPFQVDNPNTFEDSHPSVALDDQGRFIISYVGFNSTGSGVFAQQGSVSGSPAIAASVTTVAISSFSSFVFYQTASVAADAAGDFVVAYEPVSFFSVSSSSVYAQRYDPSANPLGSPIALSTSGVAVEPSVAMNRSTGAFAVTWVEASTSAPTFLSAQTFDATGATAAGPFTVNPGGDPPSSQVYDTPAVAADSAGDYVAVWAVHGISDATNDPDPTGNLYAQSFNGAGTLTGSTIVVSSLENAPGPIAVAMDAIGDYVVAYPASEQTVATQAGLSATGNSYDVFAAIFPKPVVTASTANQYISATTIVISGFDFDPTPGNNIVVLSSGAVGNVTVSSATSLTVTFTTAPTSLGNLTAVVTTDGISSGSPVQVATVIPGFADQTLSFTQSTFTGSVTSGTTVTIAGSMAFFLKRDLGLTLHASAVSQFGGITAKWLQGTVNSFHNNWYYITPAGLLFAWNGSAAVTGSTQLGALDPVYYVYPDLLYSASSATFDYVLQQRLGLTFTGNFYQNSSGQNEKWLKGNSNNYGNPWYYIDTTGSLYSWDGTAGTASGTLLAKLDTLYWAQPQRLYSAQPGEVTAAVTNNVLTVTTVTDWAGHEVVELTNTAPASHQIFTLNFVNHAPVLSSIPNQTVSASGSPLRITLSQSDADNDALGFSAVAGNLGFLLKQTLGLRMQGSLSTNAGGQDEIWLQSTLNNWYFLKPDGTLYKWDGTAGKATGTLVATLDPVFYYHPDLITNPSAGDLAYALDQHLNLTNTGNLYLNSGGANEKWLMGSDGWYFIKPSGQLYKWDGTAGKASGTLMATLSSSYYTNIQLLSDAQPAQQITTGVQGNTLTITATPSLIGQTVWILVEVEDSSQAVTTMFQVTVTA
jgi:hypothetical protein